MLLCTHPAVADIEFHADVMPLIDANCITCHASDGVSFSFEDPDETYNFRAAIALAVRDDRMPPWLAEPGHHVLYTHGNIARLWGSLRHVHHAVSGAFAVHGR